MKNLFKFELLRLKYKKIILFLPLIVFGIGFVGAIIGSAYSETVSNEMKMLSIYQSYTQFSFIFLGFIYAYVFTEDFSKGIGNYLEQMGYSLLKQLIVKIIILFILTCLSILLFTLVYSLIIGFNDCEYICLLLASIIFGILFIIIFTCFVSVLLKKVLLTTLVEFVLYILFDVINIYLYGLTNPCDANSLSTITFKYLSGIELGHKTLETLNLSFESNKILFTLGPAAVYAIIFSIILFIIVRTRRRITYGK